jgi:hypothetical protein
MVLRFAGFELDRQRAELRGRDGKAIKLQAKTLGILNLLGLLQQPLPCNCFIGAASRANLGSRRDHRKGLKLAIVLKL